jgi:hypothetical protein
MAVFAMLGDFRSSSTIAGILSTFFVLEKDSSACFVLIHGAIACE